METINTENTENSDFINLSLPIGCEMSLEQILSTKQALHRDLQRCIFKREKFTILSNKFIICVPYNEQENCLINTQYLNRVQHAKKCLQNRDYAAYIAIHEKPYRLDAFLNIEHELNNKEYWQILHDIWISSENIWQLQPLWIEAFRAREGWYRFMTSKDNRFFKRLPQRILIFRGCNDTNRNGLSWTLDEPVAKRFAKRWNDKKGFVLEREVNKADVFAYTNQRDEREIIYLPTN